MYSIEHIREKTTTRNIELHNPRRDMHLPHQTEEDDDDASPEKNAQTCVLTDLIS